MNNKSSKSIFKIEHWKVVAALLVVYDMVAVNLSYFLALWLRFDTKYSSIPVFYLDAFTKFTPIYTIICILIFWRLRLYKSIWRFASYNELIRCIFATILTSFIQIIGITVFLQRMPISYYFIGMVLQFCFIVGIRFSYRFVILLRGRRMNRGSGEEKRCMLIGAGNAGQMILRELRSSQEIREKVCCIIDDNPNKWHRYIEGIPVVGGRDDILLNVEEYNINKIYIAIPAATAENRRDILNICKETKCELKNLPGIYQLASGEVSIKDMKDVAIEDLLGRDTIELDLSSINSFLKGKTVLVTGGGGSIGSELCRQIASHSPRRLVIFDIYENNAYDIQNELRKKYPNLDLVVLIGSVRDSGRLKAVFSKYHPQIVYHAAAHKHVPLMEDSPCEAIKNNAIGTYKTAYAAMRAGCEKFVLISTDKAVNPTNIMGASKRLCEMVIQTFDHMIQEHRESELIELSAHMDKVSHCSADEDKDFKAKTRYVAVRFGNVLGSNGSVVPLFRKQIAAGGPVTVTHPDIVRYFMTIPEAVSLVLQAGVMAKGSEIFVLDMGAPVKIDTLARNLIKLSGFKPDVDIKIEYTGLRPGEKLYEEKLMAEEGLKTTANHLIHIGMPIAFDNDEFIGQLKTLMESAYDEDDEGIIKRVCEAVSTFHPDSNG
ncbi:MAG: polysaccharide biosynthesis protein [Lachnospiraceae bacterium]|nr:polysaccharide biosynthesis protein [Lachnospiraceae bacterium]